jgi:hypothetical protein
MRRLALPLLLLALVAADARAGSAGRAAGLPAQTKTHAELNVLMTVERRWKTWGKYGLVDPRTHLLKDNTEAVCKGRGRRHAHNQFGRFLCVVRPHVHRGREGLWLSYRALSKGRFKVRFLAYHSR